MPSCPEGWQQFDGKCFFWVTNQKRNWTEAENFCKSKGRHLASVTSKEINKYILEEVKKRKLKVWIGATDQKEEGVWEWSCLFRFNNWVTKGTTVLSFTTSPMSTKGDGMTSRVPFSAKLCLQHNYLFRYKRYILRVL